MQKLLLSIDRLSTRVGHACSWLIVVLTFMIAWEVFCRYALGRPHAWAFDAMIILYGTLFMMSGAYTLAKNGHVRGDVLYGFLAPRGQAALDLVLYLAFFTPGVVALTYAGYFYAAESWAIAERSSIASDGLPLYPFKAVIPVAGAFILLQGVVEMLRCVVCLRDGSWPSREQDVQETDVAKLAESLHLTPEAADAGRATQ